jgi:hypothetical protein
MKPSGLIRPVPRSGWRVSASVRQQSESTLDAQAGIVHVFGYQCVVRLGEWAEGDLAACVVPDSLVPLDRPEFAFLAIPDKPRARGSSCAPSWSGGTRKSGGCN